MVPEEVRAPRLQQAALVARLYYQNQLPLQNIARQLEVSESYVSRLLSEAKKYNLVRFYVVPPELATAEEDQNLGAELQREFRLDKAVVAQVTSLPLNGQTSSDYLHETLGMILARKLYEGIYTGLNIALGSGRGVFYTARWIKVFSRTGGISSHPAPIVTALCGAMYTKVLSQNHKDKCIPLDADFSAAELGRIFPNARLRLVGGPDIVRNPDALRPPWLMEKNWHFDADVSPEILSQKYVPDWAIIGAAEFRYATELCGRHWLLDAPMPQEAKQLLDEIAAAAKELPEGVYCPVAEVCHNLIAFSPPQLLGRTWDLSSRLEEIKYKVDEFNNKFHLGVSLRQLQRIQRRIVVAGGEEKVDVLWSLLTEASDRTGTIRPTELCTDAKTALELLRRKRHAKP